MQNKSLFPVKLVINFDEGLSGALELSMFFHVLRENISWNLFKIISASHVFGGMYNYNSLRSRK